MSSHPRAEDGPEQPLQHLQPPARLVQRGSSSGTKDTDSLFDPPLLELSQRPRSYRDPWNYTEIPLLLSAALGPSESALERQRG